MRTTALFCGLAILAGCKGPNTDDSGITDTGGCPDTEANIIFGGPCSDYEYINDLYADLQDGDHVYFVAPGDAASVDLSGYEDITLEAELGVTMGFVNPGPGSTIIGFEIESEVYVWGGATDVTFERCKTNKIRLYEQGATLRSNWLDAVELCADNQTLELNTIVGYEGGYNSPFSVFATCGHNVHGITSTCNIMAYGLGVDNQLGSYPNYIGGEQENNLYFAVPEGADPNPGSATDKWIGDPEFVAYGTDWHLKSTSPAIDACTVSSLSSGLDIDGDAWIDSVGMDDLP